MSSHEQFTLPFATYDFDSSPEGIAAARHLEQGRSYSPSLPQETISSADKKLMQDLEAKEKLDRIWEATKAVSDAVKLHEDGLRQAAQEA